MYHDSGRGLHWTPTICPGDVVVLNLRSKNCEQAIKGSLVNVTKIKLLHRSDVSASDLSPFPKSMEQYQELKQFVAKQATLTECVEMDKGKFFCFVPTHEWFVNSKDFETTNCFTLSNGVEAYELPWKLVTEVIQCGPVLECYKRARKVLELIVASGSVRVVVSMPGDVLFSDKDKPRVLDFNVDYSKFLCLDNMRTLERHGEIESDKIHGVFKSVTAEDGEAYKVAVGELKNNKVVVQDEMRNMIVSVDTRKVIGTVAEWQEQLKTDFPIGGCVRCRSRSCRRRARATKCPSAQRPEMISISRSGWGRTSTTMTCRAMCMCGGSRS